MLAFPVRLPGTSTVSSRYEELECLYAVVGKVIYEGLTNHEKATSSANPTQLFGKTPTSTNTLSLLLSLLVSLFLPCTQSLMLFLCVSLRHTHACTLPHYLYPAIRWVGVSFKSKAVVYAGWVNSWCGYMKGAAQNSICSGKDRFLSFTTSSVISFVPDVRSFFWKAYFW